ncbi:D,D-heptose 1,7-bisphosphate phosphatase [Rufibacter sp. DG15C]|uniref:D-glycero-alpha-D-manno-heptose-1,7-bisphosphate 7-phosphatase n=1 Tax=Rufibacter sp. DG15C TaxID=1379909 RepID=UPI00078C8BC5|nr:HAD family hydrolase [Rufibacter sp. DG15C]AMM52673.1 D,D-heptose 1,7-bisphosphate phosphatase [Rufibacter sp. DG15C]
MPKAIFLDRDGVLNVERGAYTFKTEDFDVCAGVPEALTLLKQQGYYLIVITNQGGIAKGLYTKEHVLACHEKLQQACGGILDALYMAPAHESVSASIARKPDSLMLEKAMAKFNVDPAQCWMVGDQLRDMQAAEKVGVKGVLVGDYPAGTHPFQAENLLEAATRFILPEGQK